jgi:hypothetical protein
MPGVLLGKFLSRHEHTTEEGQIGIQKLDLQVRSKTSGMRVGSMLLSSSLELIIQPSEEVVACCVRARSASACHDEGEPFAGLDLDALNALRVENGGEAYSGIWRVRKRELIQ